MLPSLAINNKPDCSLIYPVLLCEAQLSSATRIIGRSDSHYICGAKFSPRRIFASGYTFGMSVRVMLIASLHILCIAWFSMVAHARAAMPSLYYTIPTIIFGCSCPQMSGIDASGGVAGMTNKHPFRDWAVMQLITEAMGIHPTFSRSPEHSVALAVVRADPQPAAVRVGRTLDIPPKTLLRRGGTVIKRNSSHVCTS